MKKLLTLASIVLLGFTSCSKDTETKPDSEKTKFTKEQINASYDGKKKM